MRFSRLLVSGMALLCLLAGRPLCAQNLPCIPDCPNDKWIGPLYHEAIVSGPGCPACGVEIEFYKREACVIDGIAQFFDFQITNVKALSHSACLTCPIGTIIQQAALALLRDNPMGFPPYDAGICALNWRISAAPCWKGVRTGAPHPYPPYDRIEPCSATDCCWQAYEVCIDIQGRRTFRPLSARSTPITCDVTLYCAKVCDYLNIEYRWNPPIE